MLANTARRALGQAPWHAAATVGTIALTVALSTTVFAVVDGVLFKSLPFPAPERLYIGLGVDAFARVGSLSASEIETLRRADPRVGVASVGRTFRLLSVERPDVKIWAREIDSQFFDVLGSHPAIGGFGSEDFQIATNSETRPAIISEALSRQLFGSGAQPIGRVTAMFDRRLRIVGVLPRDFVFPASSNFPTDVLLPFVVASDAPSRSARVAGEGLIRLRADISPAEGRARLDAALVSQAAPLSVSLDPYLRLDLQPVAFFLGRDGRPTLVVAFVAAALLVMLGAVNVTLLTVARSQDRRAELAMRVALGARHRDLVRMLLSESALIAGLGGTIGLACTKPLLYLAVSLLPDNLLLLKEPTIDVRVVLFAFAAAIVPLVLVSVAPAISATRRAMSHAVVGDRVAEKRSGWDRRVLLMVESLIGLVLILSSSLVVAGFLLLRTNDTGLAASHLALVEVRPLVTARQEGLDTVSETVAALVSSRLQSVPGVQTVAEVGTFVLEGILNDSEFERPGGSRRALASDIPVSGAFFDISGLRVLDGRVPTADELARRLPVAIVSKQVAVAYWPGRRAVGQILKSQDSHATVTVIGVVSDARWASQAETLEHGEIYVPEGLVKSNRFVFLLQTAGDPDVVARAASAALRHDLPSVLVLRATSLRGAIVGTIRHELLASALSGVASGAALLVVAVGIAGLAAMGAARRRKETAIRIALGATRARVVTSLVLGPLYPVMCGVGAGLLVSWWVSRLISGYVYQIDTHDMRIWAGSVGLILAVAGIAAWLPAHRTTAGEISRRLRTD